MSIEETQQWHLLVQVSHGPSFGHRITMQEKSRGREPTLKKTVGSWRGLGIPEATLRQATATIQAVIEEHLLNRYGVRGELTTKWSGEPGPF